MTIEAVRQAGALTEIRITRAGRSFLLPVAQGRERETAFLPRETAPVFCRCEEAADIGQKAYSAAPRQAFLPVLLGAGAGFALAETVGRLEDIFGPDFFLVVVDKETDILAETDLRERFSAYSGITWITAASPEQALKELTRQQQAAGILRLFPIVHPLYLRMDREYYATLRTACEAGAKADFWTRVRYAKFAGASPTERTAYRPRILLLTSAYFLMGEVTAACRRLGVPHRLLQIPAGELAQGEFIEQFLTAVVEFKPDFAFTINHLGVDREGVLTDLFERLRLPLASWFVDNPHLILSLYSSLVSPWVSLFTWDADNVDSLRALGFEHVRYLPLGTDVTRFVPPNRPPDPAALTFVGASLAVGSPSAGAGSPDSRLWSPDLGPRMARPLSNAAGRAAGDLPAASSKGRPGVSRHQSNPSGGLPKNWPGDISFVGNSMVSKIDARRNRSRLPAALLTDYRSVAAGFAVGEERSVQEFLSVAHPHLLPHFTALNVEDRLGYETMLTWEATLQYRLACVRSMLPYRPLLVGDAGWNELLGDTDDWFYHSELNYYEDLPRFYPCSRINFNCTSKQMKGAVNQRVFDVPATRSFLLTDYREQVEHLFEPGREIICYASPEEATALAARWLAAPKERKVVVEAAYRRVHAEHTYDRRLITLMDCMLSIYG